MQPLPFAPTVAACGDCGHSWITRVPKPKRCPDCNHKNGIRLRAAA